MAKAEIRAYARQRPSSYQTQLGLEPREIPYTGKLETFKFLIHVDDPQAWLWHDALMKAAVEVDAELLDVMFNDDTGNTVFEFDREISQDRIIEIVGEMVTRG